MNDRRKQILDAALEVFLAKGFANAAIADIRKPSGATTGSIYHFFGGKADIARTLLFDAIATWTALSGEDLRSGDPERMIRAYVRGFLEWGLSDHRSFLFVDELRGRAFTDPAFAELRKDFEDGQLQGENAYRDWVERGKVRDLPWSLAYALIVGPSYAYLRSSGLPDGDVRNAAIAALVDAAWLSVRA